MSDPWDEILVAARLAAEDAYCPYSGFHVGAAVATDRGLFHGCNVENASYGLTVCAERAAIFSAIAGGATRLLRLAVTCPDAPADSPPSERMPCGACRQVMAEFAGDDFAVLVDGVGTFKMTDLLPVPFVLRGQA